MAASRLCAASRIVSASPNSSTSSPGFKERSASSSGGSSSLFNFSTSVVVPEILVQGPHEQEAADDDHDGSDHQRQHRRVEALVEYAEVDQLVDVVGGGPGDPLVHQSLYQREHAHGYQEAGPHYRVHSGEHAPADVLGQVLVQQSIGRHQQVPQLAAPQAVSYTHLT